MAKHTRHTRFSGNDGRSAAAEPLSKLLYASDKRTTAAFRIGLLVRCGLVAVRHGNWLLNSLTRLRRFSIAFSLERSLSSGRRRSEASGRSTRPRTRCESRCLYRCGFGSTSARRSSLGNNSHPDLNTSIPPRANWTASFPRWQ